MSAILGLMELFYRIIWGKKDVGYFERIYIGFRERGWER